MALIENETVTRPGACPTHGRVTGVKDVPKLKFPFVISGTARGFAALRRFRCRECGAKVS